MTPEWMMAVLTFIYVITTILILVSNNKMADATRRQVDELQKQFQAQNRPYVCVQFETIRNGLLCLSVENTGNTPARNVRVLVNEDFTNKIHDQQRDRFRKFTETAIYLSPRQKLYCCLGGPSDFSSIKDQTLLLDVTYDGDDDHYQEHIEIDVDGYGWALLYESPLGDISIHIKKISESLESIEKKLR